MALLYALSISWSINSTCHYFIHNTFFRSEILNRLFGILPPVNNGFSQELYRHVHLRHHVGNGDRIGANGRTIDPMSSLSGYHEHFKSDPDTPIAWRGSTCNKLYNRIWLYNGRHAEHHYRPKRQWSGMVQLRNRIADEQRTLSARRRTARLNHGAERTAQG